MSAKLSSSITAFAADLRSFVQRASDSITALKRTAEQRPQAGGGLTSWFSLHLTV
jgi:hypothetical protein